MMINNRQVNLWRGTDAPPTIYHIWIKDKKLWIYDGEKWIVFVDSVSTEENILALYDIIAKYDELTINGKLVKNNPELSATDIAIGKTFNYVTATQSVLDAIEIFDKHFKDGYPITVSESEGVVTVKVGEEKFTINTNGAISVSVDSGNKIIMSSNALSSIDTEKPLVWSSATKKLTHAESGVTTGSYGQSADASDTNTFKVPYIVVDVTGHVTNASDKTITIRDYVQLLAPVDEDGDKPVLLSYNSSGLTKTYPTRMANGMTYNDHTKTLKVGGEVLSNGAAINGNLVVTNGTIKGTFEGDITGKAQPKIHSSNDGSYGLASLTLYGHVRILDTLGDTQPKASNTNTDSSKTDLAEDETSTAASPLMVWNALEAAKAYSDLKQGSIITLGIKEDNTVKSLTEVTFSEDFCIKDDTLEINWKEL